MHIMSLMLLQASEIRNSKPISHELLEELLLELAIKNQERTSSCKVMEYIWSSDVVEFTFNVCEMLKLKRNVKYHALEIYERFIAEHVVETRKLHLDLLKKKKESLWENIQERLKEQSVLRVLTSIQLASKLESHYEHVLPAQISEILEKCGKPFSLNGIFSSELRMLKALKHKVHFTTPALYLELLLYVLFTNDPCIEEEIYESSMNVLDFVYLHRTELYNVLYETITGENSDTKTDFNEVFLKIKADYMLLASAITAGTAYMFVNRSYENILEQLHQITRILKKDIHNFSVIIAFVVSNDL